jgi:DNA-binding GntR family transcriptional regulator
MPLHTAAGLNVADLYPGPTTPGEETYAAIRRSILEGVLRPGERIVEQQLAEMLNVSRTPVREALLKLERENLVARVGRGMAVRRYSSDEVRDIYNLRAHLESFAARMAAQRITEGELITLSRIQDQMDHEPMEMTPEVIRALSRDNQRFHAMVVGWGGVPRAPHRSIAASCRYFSCRCSTRPMSISTMRGGGARTRTIAS